MSETTKIVSQRDALRKYQNITHRGDGTCEVIVRYKDDGSEDPSCWNMQYRAEMEKKNESKKENKNNKKGASSKKGYFGMSRWNPLCWIIWIILLPFKIIKWILKLFGIWAIINLFTGNKD